MQSYIQLQVDQLPGTEQEILIAWLSVMGFEGFEEDGSSLKAYISFDQFNEQEVRDFLDRKQLVYQITQVAPVNWNEAWEKHFQPVLIDDFCGIRAVFHPPLTSVAHEIIITPKMSFGTGHHATTWLMIRAMRSLDFHNKEVLDFGTGAGILAILAEQMGAVQVMAIDNDDWSIQNAGENIAANHCTSITLLHQSYIPAEGYFDIILANINKQVILATLGFLQQHLTPQGVLIVSGLLRNDLEELAAAALRNNLKIIQQEEKNDWLLVLLTHA